MDGVTRSRMAGGCREQCWGTESIVEERRVVTVAGVQE